MITRRTTSPESGAFESKALLLSTGIAGAERQWQGQAEYPRKRSRSFATHRRFPRCPLGRRFPFRQFDERRALWLAVYRPCWRAVRGKALEQTRVRTFASARRMRCPSSEHDRRGKQCEPDRRRYRQVPTASASLRRKLCAGPNGVYGRVLGSTSLRCTTRKTPSSDGVSHRVAGRGDVLQVGVDRTISPRQSSTSSPASAPVIR